MDKEALRAKMRAKRRALTAQEQNEAAQAVMRRLEGFEPFCRARCVMAYMACRGEMSVLSAMEAILRSGKTLALPRCEAPGVMTARQIARFSQLVPGAHGILEPDSGCALIAPEEIDLILVPGTAFDAQGGRLGQGGGYYDRFLSRTRALRVGVCHRFALLERVPVEAHDLHMHVILTPGGMIDCGRGTDNNSDVQEERT
ncbi:MAG: 5-formyltetrahydrofolate cyclo-ligase [Clostridia bacterium]|nr:5-formyltetrahydrofolate cyclo-ligase [Clostridia bacterium]